MKGVMEASGLQNFDAVIPNEIGGMNAFEALLAGHRFGKTTLDTDLVARAYPYLWQTVRCLNDISITPAAIAAGNQKVINNLRIILVLPHSPSNEETRSFKPHAIISKPKTSCEKLAQSLAHSQAYASIQSMASKPRPYPATASRTVLSSPHSLLPPQS